MPPGLSEKDIFWIDCCLSAYLIALHENRHHHSDYVKSLAYGHYERNKDSLEKTVKL